ncbi:MAG: SDR family oxidoreductase [Deltaproteobacteria bacterium]|nr:SDR family oxidoreductase [Deltaproteobacteria bacterium]
MQLVYRGSMLVSDALHDRTLIVTGGGTGLGRAMSQRFLELGARVVIAARNLDRLEAAAAELRARTQGEVLAVQLDVRDAAACDAMVKRTVERFGKVDGLVNNAAGNFLCAAEDLTPGGFDAVVGIVMKGSFNTTLSVGKQLIAQGGGGAILSILTTYAWTGSAFVLPSAMAKAGVLAMTRSLAVEWGSAHAIRLNAIAPGPFPTEGAWGALVPDPAMEEEAKRQVPLKRFGDPVELANLAAYLLSDFSGYINGDCITIDGGSWLKGAGEFNRYCDFDRDAVRQTFAAMRPKKS